MRRGARALPRLAIALLAALLAALFACRSTLPPERAARPASGLLDGLSTRAELTDWLGQPPHACLDLDARRSLCEWRLLRGSRRYPTIAGEMGIEDQVGILCVLPSDGDPREPGPCTLHQRRSNRDHFGRSGSARPARGRSRADQVAALRAEARRMLDDARTLLAMSRMLGELPGRCESLGAERRCEWLLSDQSFGHGTVVRMMGGDTRRKVRFACDFPSDGGDRRADACEAWQAGMDGRWEETR